VPLRHVTVTVVAGRYELRMSFVTVPTCLLRKRKHNEHGGGLRRNIWNETCGNVWNSREKPHSSCITKLKTGNRDKWRAGMQLQRNEWTIQVNKACSPSVCFCFVMTELWAGETVTEVVFRPLSGGEKNRRLMEAWKLIKQVAEIDYTPCASERQSPRANYTDRATAACRRWKCQLLWIEGATWSAWRSPTAVFSIFWPEQLLFFSK
jgi:hypothetical protein